jgi:hydrocephalus-inducing protein
LHIIINNGVDLEVVLRAKGVGSTLYCKDNLNTIDFGTEYTFSNITREFFLENRGRKQMKIQWVRNVKPERKPNPPGSAPGGKKPDDETASSKKGGNDKTSNAEAQSQAGEKEGEESKQVFTVIPDTIVLNPKMGIMVQFRANSPLVGKIIENWLCNVTQGGERKPRIAYNSNV